MALERRRALGNGRVQVFDHRLEGVCKPHPLQPLIVIAGVQEHDPAPPRAPQDTPRNAFSLPGLLWKRDRSWRRAASGRQPRRRGAQQGDHQDRQVQVGGEDKADHKVSDQASFAHAPQQQANTDRREHATDHRERTDERVGDQRQDVLDPALPIVDNDIGGYGIKEQEQALPGPEVDRSHAPRVSPRCARVGPVGKHGPEGHATKPQETAQNAQRDAERRQGGIDVHPGDESQRRANIAGGDQVAGQRSPSGDESQVYSIERRAKGHPALHVAQDQADNRPSDQGTVERKIPNAKGPHAHAQIGGDGHQQRLQPADLHACSLPRTDQRNALRRSADRLVSHQRQVTTRLPATCAHPSRRRPPAADRPAWHAGRRPRVQRSAKPTTGRDR